MTDSLRHKTKESKGFSKEYIRRISKIMKSFPRVVIIPYGMLDGMDDEMHL